MELDEATKNVIVEANNLETAIKNAEASYSKLAVWEAECRTDEVKKFFQKERRKLGVSIERMTKQLENIRIH